MNKLPIFSGDGDWLSAGNEGTSTKGGGGGGGGGAGGGLTAGGFGTLCITFIGFNFATGRGFGGGALEGWKMHNKLIKPSIITYI